MARILLVQTGGTIQSSLQSHIIDIQNTRTTETNPLIEAYNTSRDTNVSWEVLQPLELLSENITLSHWNTFISFLYSLNWQQYDGIILAHGSDTLAYTSCLLGLLLGNHIDIPLVLIASNYVLEDSRSNGIANFCAAVDFILTGKFKGVFTIYQDSHGQLPVYLATRLLPADCYLDAFSDFGGAPFGYMKDTSFIPADYTHTQSTDTLFCNQNMFSHLAKRNKPFTKNIFCITPYPGLHYSSLSFAQNHTSPAAVLHGLYHSGTLCNSPEPEYSFEKFCCQCNENNIPVYLCSMKEKRGNQYASIALVTTNTQAIPLYNISFPAAYCKLLIAYNQDIYTPLEYMNVNLYHEILKPI